ncbi:hypothetical protein CISIN_1g035196mg [Citrus sinensis]|uniref:Uncharacterized protein n=1 Tax=Citrus sinensis TaxID=2711 RepID=A0A067EWV3_CITSI|nr:hypothetical protein CISIN_1g035196mg [Citrus sinensis]
MVCCWFGSMGPSGSAGFDAAVSREFEWLLLHHTSSSGWCWVRWQLLLHRVGASAGCWCCVCFVAAACCVT